MGKKLILTGKAASGKDHMAKWLRTNTDRTIGTKSTTRPPRSGEVHGVHYNFLDDISFDQMLKNDEIIMYQSFFISDDIVWKYGYRREDFKSADTFLLTPYEISILGAERQNATVVYFDIPEETRRIRLSLRKDADSVERRLDGDRKDFQNFFDYDIIVTDPLFDCGELYKSMVL